MGGVSTYSTAPTQVENPYTISNLQFNCKINSSINIDNRPVITNMANYARLNIPNYITIASIPSGHLPTDINTSLAQNWYSAFGGLDLPAIGFIGMQLTSLPDPFYNTSNAIDMNIMFFGCYNLTTVPNFDTSKVTYMNDIFYQCTNIKGNLYIESNNVSNARNIFAGTPNYTKNIYCHANTTTYNTIYRAMGNTTYNSDWNAYLKTF